MKKSFVLAIVFITLIGTMSSLAQKGKVQWRKGFNECKLLDLTNEQQEKFDEIKFQHAEKQIELEAQLKKNQLEIKKLLNKDNFNETDLMNLVKSSSAIKAEKMMNKTKMWVSINNILDKDQKEIWKKRFNKLEKRKGKFNQARNGDCFKVSPRKNRM